MELSVKLKFGATGVAELHTLWGSRTLRALTSLRRVEQTTAVDELRLGLAAAKHIHLDTAHLAEQEAAHDALRAALVRSQRAAQAACSARLSLAADNFDAAWSRLVKLAGFVLGAEAERYVPDLGPLRR